MANWNRLDLNLWAHIQVGAPDTCWPWLRGKNGHGYGSLHIDGKRVSAHRRAYELAHGAIPDGMCVCHTCDNPPCCNPAHLWLGTPADNAHDKTAKGRAGAARGEKNAKAKLTADQVRAIRKLGRDGVGYRLLSEQFGVCSVVICKIVNRKIWKSVED